MNEATVSVSINKARWLGWWWKVRTPYIPRRGWSLTRRNAVDAVVYWIDFSEVIRKYDEGIEE